MTITQQLLLLTVGVAASIDGNHATAAVCFFAAAGFMLDDLLKQRRARRKG